MPKHKNNRMRVYLGASFILTLTLAVIYAVYSLPFFQSINDIGKIFEWIGIYLLGMAALFGVWMMMRRPNIDSLLETNWDNSKHCPERLSNIKLEQMIRVERQFVLDGQKVGLLVMLVMLLKHNHFSEDAIATKVQPLVDLKESNHKLESNLFKTRQMKDREQFLEKLFANIVMKGKIIPITASTSTTSYFPKSKFNLKNYEDTSHIVRTIIELDKQGYRQEDIEAGLPVILKNPEATPITLLRVKMGASTSKINPSK